jgi:hypothetical protein
MTPADQRRFLALLEEIRLDAEATAYTRFYRVLSAQIAAYIAAVNRTGTQIAGLQAMDELLGQIRAALTETYADVWPQAAALEMSVLSRAGYSALIAPETPFGIVSGPDGLRRVERWVQDATRFAEGYAGSLVQKVSDTTKEQVRQVTLQALDEGLSIPDTMRRLQEVWPDLAAVRAERIARTEVVSASNYGVKAGAETFQEETGVVLRKLWISTDDDRTREDHKREYMGSQSPLINEQFVVGGELADIPGDTNLSAAMRVNCRCSAAYVPAEDAASFTEQLAPNLRTADRRALAKEAYRELKAQGLTREDVLERIAERCAVSPSTIKKDIWG